MLSTYRFFREIPADLRAVDLAGTTFSESPPKSLPELPEPSSSESLHGFLPFFLGDAFVFVFSLMSKQIHKTKLVHIFVSNFKVIWI